MPSEIRAVKDEKSYWEERLNRMSKQIETLGRTGNTGCRPLTKKRFNLYLKKNNFSKSKLLETGALSVSKTFQDLQKTRKMEREGMRIEQHTSRKNIERSVESKKANKSLSPLGQGLPNDNLHPFSEINGIYQP